MKLTINLPLLVYWQALGEALALCRPLGIDPARAHRSPVRHLGRPQRAQGPGPALVKMLKGEDRRRQ